MSTSLIVVVAALGWVAVVGLLRWLAARMFATGPGGGDPVTGLMWLAFRGYSRLMHRVTYVGLEHVPGTNRPGGLIVVSNHTGPVDPVLIQAACRFEIRWMMAEQMMIPQLDWLWRRYRMIPVVRDGRDSGPAREAIRHVRGGGVIGIFPEGGIVRPRGEIRPFHRGVGLIIAKSRAPVLLVWVSGTPEATELFEALRSPSRTRIRFVDHLEFGNDRDPAAITEHLRRRLVEASGWPIRDEPVVPPPRADPDPFAPPQNASGTMPP